MSNELVNETILNLEKVVNAMPNTANTESVVTGLMRMHRTLNQAFTGKIVFRFIQRMADIYRDNNYDARNEAACRICSLLWDVLEKEVGINPHTERIELPML